jgi:flagellar hook protein FlgE
MRALFSGVTGIRSHQVRMDVIGNNIANVNTTGFKSSRVTFQDVFSQTLSMGSAETAPQQVGLGVGIASTDLDQAAGSFQLTGRDLDLAIEGNGMFVLRGTDGQAQYTRVGNFDWDSNGYLVNPGTGLRVQGWPADKNGNFGTLDRAALGDIQVVKGAPSPAQKTASATLGGNLDAGAKDGDSFQTTLTAYDSLGRAQSITLKFTKSTTNSWTWTAQADPTIGVSGTGVLSFNTDGTIATASKTGTLTMNAPGATLAQTLTLDLSAMTQAYAGQAGSSVLVRQADGYPMGTLESAAVDASGKVVGLYSNGTRRVLGQVAVANFTNPDGLLKVGNSSFAESADSGAPMVGQPSTGGRGRIVAGNLEMSNVDLSTEFTNMIITQRGFQANTRVISAADEMLQDLVNLRR